VKICDGPMFHIGTKGNDYDDDLGNRMDGLRKTTKSLSQDSRSSGLDLKPGPLENEAGMLITRPRLSVPCCNMFLGILDLIMNVCKHRKARTSVKSVV
jgi:hypothetical protein